MEELKPEERVDRIMAAIRQKIAARRTSDPPSAEPVASTEVSQTLQPPPGGVHIPRFQPEAPQPDPQSGHYKLNDFLGYDDGTFLHLAFRALLGRPPDPESYDFFGQALATARMSQVEVLGHLQISPEAQARGAQVQRLRARFLWARVTRKIPLVGYILRWVLDFLRLPARIGALRQENAGLRQRLAESEQRLAGAVEMAIHDLRRRLHGKVEAETLDFVRGRLASLELEKGDSETVDYLLQEVAQLPLIAGHVIDLESRWAARSDEIDARVRDLRESLLDQERRLSVLLEEARKCLPESIGEAGLRKMVNEQHQMIDLLYATLEDHFRGTRDDIRNRQRRFVERVRELPFDLQDHPVLDLGCGRGEWLEVLGEADLPALGVDASRAMVDRCLEFGLQVEHSEILDFLRSQRSESYGFVSCFHVIEHLEHELVLAVLDESFRALRRGGALLLETPNPNNLLVGSRNFYLDPTHRNPIPPQLLRFLVEARGFCRIEVIPLHPYDESFLLRGSELADRFNELFYGPQDYAVLGYKV